MQILLRKFIENKNGECSKKVLRIPFRLHTMYGCTYVGTYIYTCGYFICAIISNKQPTYANKIRNFYIELVPLTCFFFGRLVCFFSLTSSSIKESVCRFHLLIAVIRTCVCVCGFFKADLPFFLLRCPSKHDFSLI